MKYLHLALVGLLLVSLFSCSKNDDPAKPGNQLIGKWKMTTFTYTGTTTTTFGGESFSTPFTGEGKNMNVHIVFAENPNTYTSTGDYDIELVMDIEGQKIKQDYPIRGFMGSGNWSKDGTKLVFTDKTTEKPQAATIMQLDNKTLKVHWSGNLLTENPNNMPMTVVANGIYIFEKE